MKVRDLVEGWGHYGLATTLLAVLASPMSAQPAISLGTESLTINGVSPGGQVLLLSVSRAPVDFVYQVSTGSEILDADSTGYLSWVPENGIPVQSIWFAVETATGQGSFAFPEELEAEEMDLAGGEVIQLDANGEPTLAYLEGRRVQLWLVRPGVGAWRGYSADGGENDSGAADDGFITFDMAHAEAIDGSSTGVGSVAVGDVLMAVDTATLRYLTLSLEN